MKHKGWMTILARAATLLGWHALAQPDAGTRALGSQAAATAPAGGERPTYTTPNTMRLAGPNVYAAATAITQTTYGATHHAAAALAFATFTIFVTAGYRAR
jgi:hypothetical protein